MSLSLQTINGKDTFDDAGLPYVYGASKVLDMLGYGSFLASSNTAKAVITKSYLGKDNVADANNPLVYSASLGYNLRYWQWKSNIDTVHAAFRSGMAYQSWAAPIDGWDVLTSSGTWSYQSMKVRPQQLNSIFEPQVSGQNCSVAYDQLLCNVNFQVYAVQNLDRNGLPY